MSDKNKPESGLKFGKAANNLIKWGGRLVTGVAMGTGLVYGAGELQKNNNTVSLDDDKTTEIAVANWKGEYCEVTRINKGGGKIGIYSNEIGRRGAGSDLAPQLYDENEFAKGMVESIEKNAQLIEILDSNQEILVKHLSGGMCGLGFITDNGNGTFQLRQRNLGKDGSLGPADSGQRLPDSELDEVRNAFDYRVTGK